MKFLILQSSSLQKILLSTVILVVLLLNVDTSKLFDSFDNIRLDTWAIVITLFYFQLLALSYRWQKLVNINENKISFGYAVKTNSVGLLANYLFITTIGGVVVRIGMNMQKGVSFIKSITAAIMDRGFTFLSLVILAVIFLPVVSTIVSGDVLKSTFLLLVTALCTVAFICVFTFEELRKKVIFSHRKVSLCAQYMLSLIHI